MKMVLFVGLHDSGRSQMAQAFFNTIAEGKATAVSAGIRPATTSDDAVVQAMREVGMDIGHAQPKTLAIEMLEWANTVVTFGREAADICSAAYVDMERWELEDPRGKPVEMIRPIRDEIAAKVVQHLRGL
jgi:arsenate reductase